ncbi:MAG: alpha-glucosidase/alpha-galactosidase [Pseudomonadota bacterium]
MSVRIAFIGAGSTIFLKNIVGDALLTPALSDAVFALMDIDPARLAESETVVRKMIASTGARAQAETHADQRRALQGADFVIVAFQIGGYRPCTVTDFEIPARYGLRQTIGDTLGVAGIMRGLRTVPVLWRLCEDMTAVCPDALLLQYVNPMAINTWAIAERYPQTRQVGLCHSVQNTVMELAHDLEIDERDVRFQVAGINHMAFFLRLEQQLPDGRLQDLYPRLREGYRARRIPKPNQMQQRCPNLVRYEMMLRLGYFPTESSEHFAEYVPWFIRRGREDLIDRFAIPLDEYPKRCEEQIADWAAQAAALKSADTIPVERSHEFAADIMNAVVTDTPHAIYGNLPNLGQIPQLPHGAAVETPCLVDANGIQPTTMTDIPPQLIALMRSNVNVQELTVRALVEERRDHIYHAAMMDPHTAAELDLDQIHDLVDDLISAHRDWLPDWLRGRAAA